ncbi:hypothetical protein ZWY2020_055962 [Hordeum vulgare]|nr:hypothetical protein ZWY2020_055962 [Hordeum vulgare]
MDATASNPAVVTEFHNIVNDVAPRSTSPDRELDLAKRHFSGEEAVGQFPLTASPSILLHVLSSSELDPKDLAALEATCKFFRNPAKFPPDLKLPLPELAAFDMCQQRAMFKTMKPEEKEWLKQRCGGSWKLVLGYILVGEKNCRRGKSQVTAGPGHSIVVTTNGDVYSFGMNSSGQLGLGDTEDKFKPCLIRSLQGIRITQAAVGLKRTMLVSNTGSVYVFGIESFGGYSLNGTAATVYVDSPKVVESLKGIFVVQATIGALFSAVLSREGRVYTFSWGRDDERLGHQSDYADVEPRLVSGPLENVLVAQISAGSCYLLLLAYQPTGMSVYSVGCGQGGKLGHGNKNNEGIPQLIAHFGEINVRPMSISAGAWHATVLSCDGRVFTWGWGHCGCLGHGDVQERMIPTAVETSKAVHVSAGQYSTFVIADNGDVYFFGRGSYVLGCQDDEDEAMAPKLVTSLTGPNERFVQISSTNAWDWHNNITVPSHTVALTESGKLYACGAGSTGQLGVKLAEGKEGMPPFQVDVDLA